MCPVWHLVLERQPKQLVLTPQSFEGVCVVSCMLRLLDAVLIQATEAL